MTDHLTTFQSLPDLRRQAEPLPLRSDKPNRTTSAPFRPIDPHLCHTCPTSRVKSTPPESDDPQLLRPQPTNQKGHTMKLALGSTRDLAAAIRAVVDDELEKAGDTYVAGLIAQKVVARLRQDDPELLTKFLDQHAVNIITRMVGDISRALKTHARVNSGKVQFRKALERQEAGEPRALSAWLDTVYVVTTNEQRKRLRDMDKQDLEYAINDYANRAKINLLQATFLRALAKKIGARTVGEVYSDEELVRMWNSLQ